MRPLFAALIMHTMAGLASAADWPQWRGVNRDATTAEAKLLTRWPKDGPPLVWTCDTLGAGYSGPAVVGDGVFVMGSDGTDEFLARLSAMTGKEVWRTTIGPIFKNDWGNGPRGTPTVAEGRVYALAAQGCLVCADAATGKAAWAVDLRKHLNGKLMRGNVLGFDWGYAESPLVDGKRVVVSPGGADGTLAALDAATGKLLWRTKEVTDAASYASLVPATLHGVRQYVQLTGGAELNIGAVMKSAPRAVGVSPDDGRVLWAADVRYATAGVINTPLVVGDHVYAACGYEGGCTILKIAKTAAGFTAADVTPKDARKGMKSYHGGLVADRDRVFGYSDGRGWVCQRVPSGELLWEEKGRIGEGSVVRAGDRLYVVTTAGTVALTEPGDDGWTVHGQFPLPKKSAGRKANDQIRVCSHPVVANGRLYVRDQELLYCFDIKAE